MMITRHLWKQLYWFELVYDCELLQNTAEMSLPRQSQFSERPLWALYTAYKGIYTV